MAQTYFFRYKRGYKYFDRMHAAMSAPLPLGESIITIPASQAPSGFVDCFEHGFSVPLTIIDTATGTALDCEAVGATPSGDNLMVEMADIAQVALPQGAVVACRLTARTVQQHGVADWSASSSQKPFRFAEIDTYPHVELDSNGDWQGMTLYPEDGQTTFVEVERHVEFNYKRLKIGLPRLNQEGPSSGSGGGHGGDSPLPILPHTPISPCFVVLNFTAPIDDQYNEFNSIEINLDSDYIIISPSTWMGSHYMVGREAYDDNSMFDPDIYPVLLKIWPGPNGRWMIEFLTMHLGGV